MRIAICGTANVGKSTLIKDFLNEWDMYGHEVKTYRDVLKEKGLPHSKKTTKKSQKAILDYMVDTLKEFKKGDKVIFDRCPLDNLVYSMWAMSQEDSDVDEDFIDECIPIVREALVNLDIIFFIPITKHNNIKIEENGDRETDEKYIKEIDSFFKVLQRHYHEHPQDNPFFPRDDSPALIEVFGSRQERIQIIKLYLDNDGDLIGGDGGSEIFTSENLEMMEKLLEGQGLAKKEEDEFKAQMKKIKEELKV
jgi:thymidylate kinase